MKWKCLQFLLEKGVISFKKIDGIVWYSIEDLCFELNYEPHSYRQIYRRMPDHLKSKQNLQRLSDYRNIPKNQCQKIDEKDVIREPSKPV